MNEKKLKDNFLEENKIIFKKYKPIKQLDHGSFGNIYSVVRLKDKCVFAMKIEHKNSINKSLESEAYYLFSLQEGFGFPKLITYGKTKNYNILIETLLDKSLYSLFIKMNRKCDLLDTCLIGLQILDRLEWIHSKNIIYRDVKPENFLIGIKDPNVIYVVDFGLCKKYRSSKTGKHLLPKLTGKFSGTLIYSSSNVLKGKEASRRDDLVSLGYMLIYLFNRNLPKFPLFRDLDKEKYFKILKFKETDNGGKLYRGLPEELVEYIKYVKNLKFEQDPDYSYMRSLFKKMINYIEFDQRYLRFSWIDSKQKSFIGLPKSKSLKKISPRKRLLKEISQRSVQKIGEKKNLSVSNITDFNNKSLLVNDDNLNNIISENIIIDDKRKNSFNINEINSVSSNKNKNSSSINYINTNIKPIIVDTRKIDEKNLSSINIINCTLGGISTNRNNNNKMKINIEDTKSEKLLRKKGRMSLNNINGHLDIIPITYRTSPQKKELNFNKEYPKSPAQYIKINFNKNNPVKSIRYNNILEKEKYFNKVNYIYLTKKYIPSPSLININKNNSFSQKIINGNIYLNPKRNSSNNMIYKEINKIPMTKIKRVNRLFYKRINNSARNNFALNSNSDISSNQEIKNPINIKYYQMSNNIIPINYKYNDNLKYISNNRYNSPIFKSPKKKNITSLRMNKTRSLAFKNSFN